MRSPATRRERASSSTAAALGVLAAFIGLVTAVIGFLGLPALGVVGGGSEPGGSGVDGGSGAGPARPTAAIFLNDESGRGGSTVTVSGEGFEPGERVTLRFHTEEIGRTRTSSSGAFSEVAVTIPTSFSVFAPQQFFVVATGDGSHRSAQAAYRLTG